jgi:uncharacterized membrane protein YraQ (UPF0718 family)
LDCLAIKFFSVLAVLGIEAVWLHVLRYESNGFSAGRPGSGRKHTSPRIEFMNPAHLLTAILHALEMATVMAWDILWALILGFLLSGVVQAVVSKEEMGRLLPDDHAGTIVKACGLGAASSSCSYAATALARSMVNKGANFTAAIAFQFASTNLVLELGILLAVILGWQFTLAEFTGGLLMILLLVLLFRAFLKPQMVNAATAQAQRNLPGKMEGHAAMDISLHTGTFWQRLTSSQGQAAVSHFFFMDWYSLWADIVGGLLLAGAVGAWVPQHWWQRLFFMGRPVASMIWGPLIGPLVAMLSFVCSVGNVPLAAVLWSGGISFGGVVSFLFADLIILPILDIYRKYYGLKMAAFLFVAFYAAMAAAGLVVEVAFKALHLVPAHRAINFMAEGIRWNYTTWLNLFFLALCVRTGGPAMLRMMDDNTPGGAHGGHGEAAHCCHHGA